jgi:hypothetical protein
MLESLLSNRMMAAALLPTAFVMSMPASGVGQRPATSGEATITLVREMVIGSQHARDSSYDVFDTSGTFRHSFRVPGGGYFSHKGFQSFLDGTIGVRVPTHTGTARAGGLLGSAYVRFSLDGAVRDTIAVPDEEVTPLLIRSPNLSARSPYTEHSVFAVLPSGAVAAATSSVYRVEVRHPGPRGPLVIERRVRPLPLTAAERQEWSALLRVAAERSGGRVRPAELPRNKPLIRDLYADGDGRLWVQLYTAATRRSMAAGGSGRAQSAPGLTLWEHDAFDVFDSQGACLGRVDLPHFSKVVAVAGDRIWVATESEHGGSMIVRYRLELPRN